MKSLLFVILQCYFALYPKEVTEALNFLKENEQIINKELAPLNQEERDIAMAIVAPEISQFSKVMEFVELRSLFIMYRNFGKGDFSVGYFQMKPSFIEGLEKEINNNKSFKEKYKGYLVSGTDTDQRETRLKRLSSTE